MKIGQTSVVVFLSKVVGSALGFLATIYFARVLGAEVIGLYALVLTIVRWLKLGGAMGFGSAVEKRISEGGEGGQFLAAGIVSMFVLGTLLSAAVVLAQPVLEWYVAEFDTYVAISVVWFVVGLLFATLFYHLVAKTLRGERKVHVAGLLEPLKIGGQSLVQVGLVVAGFGLLGMLVGYGIGAVFVSLVGLLYVTNSLTRPTEEHFRSLFEYAKYSWLGSLETRSFNDVDILLLGVFVSTGLVGVYAIAWSIANFLKLFGNAVSETLFPEISHLSSNDRRGEAANLIEDSLAYGGLVAIPGLVGGIIIADHLLRIYGPEFVQGTAVLGLLILATLLYTYHRQLLNALNALDRPDVTFRINLVFIALNVVGNAVLIWYLGWIGAAIATVSATAIGLGLSYLALRSLIGFDTPLREIARQVTAAGIMGTVVWTLLALGEGGGYDQYTEYLVLTLVLVGVGVYFLTLYGISSRFRATVERNLPFRIPYTPR